MMISYSVNTDEVLRHLNLSSLFAGHIQAVGKNVIIVLPWLFSLYVEIIHEL